MPNNLTTTFGIIGIIFILIIIYLLWRAVDSIKQIIELDKRMISKIEGLSKDVKKRLKIK